MLKLRDVLLWALGIVLTIIVAGIVGALLSGCTNAEYASVIDGPRAPGRGPAALDAGFPDTVPGIDSVAADTLRAVSDSLPPLDATPAVDSLPLVDTGAAPDLSPVPDTRPATPDVLPAPDLAPECPYVAWTPPPAGSPSTSTWALALAIPVEETCFTFCSELVKHLNLVQLPWRRMEINGKLVLSEPNATSGSWPNAQPVDGRFYVVRIAAGDAGMVYFAGWPGTTTGACQ